MAVGISIGRNAWTGQFEPIYPSTLFAYEKTDVNSGKTNVCASFHFGPSAPTWGSIFNNQEGSIHDVKPYPPGMIVPFFILDIGPYFWDWEETTTFID